MGFRSELPLNSGLKSGEVELCSSRSGLPRLSAPSSHMTNAQLLAISVRSASKRYGTSLVLDNISLEVQKGEFVTLLGPSGSGKTTLLNIIAGFSQPDTGAVYFGTEDFTHVPPHRRGVGIVFQNYALFPHMSVAQNVAFPLKARRISGPEIADRVAWALSLVKLAGFGDRRIDARAGTRIELAPLHHAVAGAVGHHRKRAHETLGHAILAARHDRRRGGAVARPELLIADVLDRRVGGRCDR